MHACPVNLKYRRGKAALRYAIFGAGPTGLTLAQKLLDHGVAPSNVRVLEKDKEVGGLCKSAIVDGAPLDTGGGHFLDMRRQEVLSFLYRFMPRDEWQQYRRISKIKLAEHQVDYPLEANLWQLPRNVQIDFLESIAQAGCVRGVPKPESFAAWIRWKLGDKIAQEYMLAYNRKIWSMNLDDLGTYWLSKLPDVSFRDTLESCIKSGATGSLPAHGTFLYPKKYGYGEVWRRMGAQLGPCVQVNTPVTQFDLATRKLNDGFVADIVFNTIPWTLWPSFCEVPQEIESAISQLKNAPIHVDYCPNTLASDAHWIYEPKPSISYHRILLRANFAAGARGYWTETHASRAQQPRGIRFENHFAYPINTIKKPKAIAKVCDWAAGHNIIGAGRWGLWEHMNSDVAVHQALQLADTFLQAASA